jgi:hypothetical protein
VAIRFCRAYSGDPSLSRHLNFDLQTPDPLSDNDGSDASSTFGSETAYLVAVEEEVEIAAGQTLRSNTVVVLMVIRIVSGGSHVICKVRESFDADYMDGSKKVLTMAVARQLYTQYHNDI